MREKGLKEKEREAPTHLIELARFTHASRVTKDSYTIMHYVINSYTCTYYGVISVSYVLFFAHTQTHFAEI